MASKILTTEKSKSKYRYCNVCNKQLLESKADSSVDDNKTHELAFGHDGHSITVCLCSNCLIEFSNKLRQYIEENI